MEITEGLAKLDIPEGSDVSRKAEVFYNTRMKIARDVAVYLLKLLKPKRVYDCFGGSGVRSIRFALEAGAKDITICDLKESAVDLIKKNAALNDVDLNVVQGDAMELLEKEKFDYIDIDPFGSPVGFLKRSITGLNDNGILAVTAMDVSCLCGRYINACKRKYQAKPMICGFFKELGLRILIGKIVRDGLEEGKLLKPIFSQSCNHFLRTYVQLCSEKPSLGYVLYCPKCLNREVVEELKEKDCCGSKMDYAGPLWIGKLWDDDLRRNLVLIKYLKDEVDVVGFYELHDFSSKYKMYSPKIDEAVSKIQSLGFKASRTHFSDTGIKSDIPFDKFVELFFQ